MKHVKISILTLLAVFVLAVPVFAIVEEPVPTPEPVVQEPAPMPPADEPVPQQQVQRPVVEPTPAPESQPDPKRVQACEKRQTQIQQKTAKYVENAEKYQAVVDKLYERVQEFYATGQLTVGNYEELDGLAMQAQLKAQGGVQTLAKLNGEVDCANPELAVQGVQAFRGAAGDVKTQLRNYSTSIKNMISAMQSAHSNANDGENR